MKRTISISLLTGGADKPYAYGLATALIAQGAQVDLIGNDELDCSEFRNQPRVNYLNLRGDQSPNAGLLTKMTRVLVYYARLIFYALTAKPKIFHILWNNKFDFVDRVVLMVYYKALRKRVVLTAHNVNAGLRDSKDSAWNRATLETQYRLADHIFVHTESMKRELQNEYSVVPSRVSVIPFGINNAVPRTDLTPALARQRLGISAEERTILFFGNIVPYKGLECLVAACNRVFAAGGNYKLIIAGRPHNCEHYWTGIVDSIADHQRSGAVHVHATFIPDEDIEAFFKAADVLVLPYRHVYQSGVLFLAYSFGLPVIAADVGSLKDDIVEGETGFVFRPEDPIDLAGKIERYFASDLYADLAGRRKNIEDFAAVRNSWELVSRLTTTVYAGLLGSTVNAVPINDAISCDASLKTSLDTSDSNCERASKL